MGPDKRRRPGEQSRVGARAPGVKRCRPLERWCSNAQRPSTQLEETDDGSGGHEGWTQTTRHCRLCRKGRPCLINRPCSRTGENPPYGIPGRAMETSGAAMLVGMLAGESPVRGTYPVATVVISGDGAGDQSVESPEVKVLVGWGKPRSAPTGGQANRQVVAKANLVKLRNDIPTGSGFVGSLDEPSL